MELKDFIALAIREVKQGVKESYTNIKYIGSFEFNPREVQEEALTYIDFDVNVVKGEKNNLNIAQKQEEEAISQNLKFRLPLHLDKE